MRQLKSINIQGTLLDYFSDGISLNTLVLSQSSTQFTSYDPDSLKRLGSFWIEKQLTPYSLHIDEDYLYLSLGTGELVAIDTFSGLEMILYDLGAMVPLGVVDSPAGLFVLCGVPINDGKTTSTNICVCLCEKNTGRKLYQSQIMKGKFLPIVFNEHLWVIVDRILYKYNVECGLELQVSLKITPRFKPVTTENYVAVASNSGTMEIFNRKDLKISARILVEKNNSPPVQTGYDEISWFTGKHLYSIDPKRGNITKTVDLNSNIGSTPLLVNRELYASDDLGNLIQVNLEEKKVQRLRLENHTLWKPILCDGSVFVASKNAIYKVGELC